MPFSCLNCAKNNVVGSQIVRCGHYYRTSDGKLVQRYLCKACGKKFSSATHHSCFRQKKRHKNSILRQLLCSGVSQRRAARVLSLHRTTVVKKFLFLALEAEFRFRKNNFLASKASCVEFDDMETFEHSKCKPISISLAVESQTRRILGIEASRMPAKGRLSRLARQKYAYRPDERKLGRERLFKKLQVLTECDVHFKSDSNPHYPPDIVKFFPLAKHTRVLGKRGSIGGQGELKKVRFDPIFSLNHTCAKLRADINRLFRKTWCTTKRIEGLSAHLILYADYHNQYLSL